jgi:uncharacterized protein (TIGR03085 family)
MTSFAHAEREALADLFEQVGDRAPTLCEGWTTRDLAAHLVLRESSPASVGIAVRPLAGVAEGVRRRYARWSWEELVAAVRRPPWYSPMAWPAVEKRLNTAEFFVHHEDVRRAQPGWEPRALTPGQERALAAVLRAQARALYRNAPVGVTLRRPDGETLVARRGDGVVVSGPVPELVLHAFGRKEHARVEVTGSPEAVAALRGSPLGF